MSCHSCKCSVPTNWRRRIVQDLSLNEVSPGVFWKSCWEKDSRKDGRLKPHMIYMIYRYVFAVLFFCALLYSTVCQSHLYFIFLSNWSYLGQLVYALLSCLEVTLARCRRILNDDKHPPGEDDQDEASEGALELVQVQEDVNGTDSSNSETPSRMSMSTRAENEVVKAETTQTTVLQKMIWIMVNVAGVFPYAITIGYWLFVYKYKPDQPTCIRLRSHYITHGMSGVLALLDFFIISIPIRVAHAVFPTVAVIIYLTFSYIYEVAGGAYRENNSIYSFLNWKEYPLKALRTSLVGTVLAPFTHLLLCFGLYKLKIFIVDWTRGKCTSNRHGQQPTTHP